MGRYSTYPILFDELKTISIADLKKFGYLNRGFKNGNLNWKCRGERTGDVDFGVLLVPEEMYGYLELSYIYLKEHKFNYKVPLVAVPTNLGIGLRWYFICQRTGKRCTKLHSANGYFQHRTGIPGAMYDCQTRSHFTRLLDKVWNNGDKLAQRHMKRHYRGRLTKRYLRALSAVKRSQQFEELFLQRMERQR